LQILNFFRYFSEIYSHKIADRVYSLYQHRRRGDLILETVSVKEAAAALGVNISAVYQAARSESEEGLQAVRCGKQLRVIKDSVDKYQPRPYGDKRKEGGEG
jgi:excisionase family DNA binding protein